MQGFKDLFASERGVFAIAIVICATVLAVLHVITSDQWTSVVQWTGLTLIASKTAEKWAAGKVAESIPPT